MKLTQERLKEILDYDPETGIFTWKTSRGTAQKGDTAGCIDKNSYRVIRINGKKYYAHRLAFLYMEGYLPENEIDHIDRNKINNRRDNLREVSASCNARNQKIRENNRSGVTGVCWIKQLNKWKAQICILSKCINLGMFENLIDAAKSRWEAEVKYNFPNCNTTSSAYNYLKKHGVI